MNLGFTPDSTLDTLPAGAITEPLNQLPDSMWIRTTDARSVAGAEVGALLTADEVEWVAPAYRVGDVAGRAGLVAPLPTGLVVTPHEGIAAGILEATMAKYGLRHSPVLSEHLAGASYFTFDDPADPANYETAVRLSSERPDVIASVRFEMMPMVKPTTITPNDTLFSQQWNMTRIAAGGPNETVGISPLGV